MILKSTEYYFVTIIAFTLNINMFNLINNKRNNKVKRDFHLVGIKLMDEILVSVLRLANSGSSEFKMISLVNN